MPEDNAKATPTKMMFRKILATKDDTKNVSTKMMFRKILSMRMMRRMLLGRL